MLKLLQPIGRGTEPFFLEYVSMAMSATGLALRYFICRPILQLCGHYGKLIVGRLRGGKQYSRRLISLFIIHQRNISLENTLEMYSESKSIHEFVLSPSQCLCEARLPSLTETICCPSMMSKMDLWHQHSKIMTFLAVLEIYSLQNYSVFPTRLRPISCDYEDHCPIL